MHFLWHYLLAVPQRTIQYSWAFAAYHSLTTVKEKPDSLTHNEIRGLREDRFGTLRIGERGGRLDRLAEGSD